MITIQIKNLNIDLFDDMIADMLSNKNLEPIFPELFIRGRKLKMFIPFITQSYFAISKNVD